MTRLAGNIGISILLNGTLSLMLMREGCRILIDILKTYKKPSLGRSFRVYF